MPVIYRAISILVEILELLILVRIILSWFRISPYNPISKVVYELTEPLLSVARNLIYKIGINTGMFDFSPIVAIMILRIILLIVREIIF
ncbi:MAG: YggT family protein [Tissierellia bacterium]|mgnify:CR=1 FL=1|nr:YggT family protein [Tissierellia bacterium]